MCNIQNSLQIANLMVLWKDSQIEIIMSTLDDVLRYIIFEFLTLNNKSVWNWHEHNRLLIVDKIDDVYMINFKIDEYSLKKMRKIRIT